jgi:hypothetical protein
MHCKFNKALYKKNINKMTPNELSKFYQLTTKRLTLKEYQGSHEDLLWIKNEIKNQWAVLSNETDRRYTGRVDPGLMAVMGYRVGDTNGINCEHRRRIIMDVIAGPLPLVGDYYYMQWWGQDESAERVDAMKSWLKDKIYSPKHKNHYRAQDEWKADLFWVESAY